MTQHGPSCSRPAQNLPQGSRRAIITLGDTEFQARFRDDLAPRTCASLRGLLPIHGLVRHARWSGEAFWLPLGDTALPVQDEEATSYPAPGDILAHRAGSSEAEILIAYGPCRFASRAGQLAGTPFLTIDHDLDRLAEAGRTLLMRGAAPFAIQIAPE